MRAELKSPTDIHRLLIIWNGADPLTALSALPALARVVSLPGRWVCESWNTQRSAKYIDYYACVGCHMSLIFLLRCQDPPRLPPFPFQADTPMTWFYKWAQGPTPWAWLLSWQEVLTAFLTRAQLVQKGRRTDLGPKFSAQMVSQFLQFLRLISDVIWTFMIFFLLGPSISSIPVPDFYSLPSFTCLSTLTFQSYGSMIPGCSLWLPQAQPILWSYPLS